MTQRNYITTNCNNCGKKIQKKKKNRDQNYYCDMKCYREFQKSGNYKIEKSKTGKNVKCCVCGETYYQQASKEKTVSNNYCSRKCYLEDHSIKNKYRECEYCKNVFEAGSSSVRFCSKKCETLRYRDREENRCTCRQCKRKFCRIPICGGRLQYKCTSFCTIECHMTFLKTNEDRKDAISAAFTGSKHPNFKDGSSLYRGSSRGRNWMHIREVCFTRYENKCSKCGISRDDHFIKFGVDMHVDHIIAWHKFSIDDKETANKQSNLRPLCMQCHTKYGSISTKEDRIKRKEEYANKYKKC